MNVSCSACCQKNVGNVGGQDLKRMEPEAAGDSCDLMDSHSPGSPVLRISQTRILEWVAISFYFRSRD